MTIQIFALLIVVVGFSGLVVWVFWPSNAKRFAAGSRLAIDDGSLQADDSEQRRAEINR